LSTDKGKLLEKVGRKAYEPNPIYWARSSSHRSCVWNIISTSL